MKLYLTTAVDDDEQAIDVLSDVLDTRLRERGYACDADGHWDIPDTEREGVVALIAHTERLYGVKFRAVWGPSVRVIKVDVVTAGHLTKEQVLGLQRVLNAWGRKNGARVFVDLASRIAQASDYDHGIDNGEG